MLDHFPRLPKPNTPPLSLPTQMHNSQCQQDSASIITLPSPWRRIVPCHWWYNAALDDEDADFQNAKVSSPIKV